MMSSYKLRQYCDDVMCAYEPTIFLCPHSRLEYALAAFVAELKTNCRFCNKNISKLMLYCTHLHQTIHVLIYTHTHTHTHTHALRPAEAVHSRVSVHWTPDRLLVNPSASSGARRPYRLLRPFLWPCSNGSQLFRSLFTHLRRHVCMILYLSFQLIIHVCSVLYIVTRFRIVCAVSLVPRP